MSLDRTGVQLEHDDSLIVIEVVAKAKEENIYLLQDHVKGEPEMVGGGYFVTGVQLEVMITGYETGLWLDTQ